MSTLASSEKQNYVNKIKKKNPINIKDIKVKNNIEKINPNTIKIEEKKEIIIKTVEDEEEEKKQNLTKLKLFTALNNINDEINVKIDSKEKFRNPLLNLDCFINRPSSRKNKTDINNNYTNDKENIIEKVDSNLSLKTINEPNIQNQKEEYGTNNNDNDNNINDNNNDNNNNDNNNNVIIIMIIIMLMIIIIIINSMKII